MFYFNLFVCIFRNTNTPSKSEPESYGNPTYIDPKQNENIYEQIQYDNIKNPDQDSRPSLQPKTYSNAGYLEQEYLAPTAPPLYEELPVSKGVAPPGENPYTPLEDGGINNEPQYSNNANPGRDYINHTYQSKESLGAARPSGKYSNSIPPRM